MQGVLLIAVDLVDVIELNHGQPLTVETLWYSQRLATPSTDSVAHTITGINPIQVGKSL